MKWILIIFPLGVTFYTFTYGYWAWQKGNRRGAIGVYSLASFTLALAIYALYFKEQL